MTKKELAEVEALKTRLALRFHPEVLPDVDIPTSLSVGVVNGYMYNEHSMRVDIACTSSIYHSHGNWHKTTTQNPMRLFSTKELAYKALLNKLAEKFAADMRKVELMMERDVDE